MSSPPTIKPFKGTNGEECDEFIRAILEAARKEGKIRDPDWIADFASPRFSGQARLWYRRLPRDVRQDWEKLEAALLDRWPPPEDDDEPRIEPTPAAAPSLNRNDRANLTPQGVLKLVIGGFNKDCYLRFDIGDGRAQVTDDVNQALRIRCNSLSNTTILEPIDRSRHSWLAIQWLDSDPDLNNGSAAFGFLVLLDSLTLKTSWGEDHPPQVTSCTLATDGEVIPVWENEDTSKIAIGIFRHSSGTLCVAADPDAYAKRYPRESKVKIFIEPID